MSSKRSQLPNRDQPQDERRSRVAEKNELLLGHLKHIRRLYGRGRFGQLDLALGRKPGYLSYVQACLHFLTPKDASTCTAAHFALAYDRFESGDLQAAISDFEQIEQDLGTRTGRDYAKVVMAQAEVRSQLGDQQKADDLFERAQDELAAAGNAEDVALCGLTRMGHLLRTGRPQKSNELARELMPLAVELRDNRIGQATLLHILRLSAGGRLTVAALERALEVWTQPWKRHSKPQP